MHSYSAILETVFAHSKTQGVQYSLDNIERLCKIYNHPERAFPTIHVAGTNGKGSVSIKIATALTLSGLSTGLYTSPHISSFRERIQIDAQVIDEETVSRLLAAIQAVCIQEEIGASFFEMATLLAFLYFREKKVGAAVIETGMGGRFDATNVLSPLLSVITSIGIDHQEFLGDTLEKIAFEKAGIIKRKAPVVIGPDTPAPVFKEAAEKQGSPLFQSLFKDPDYDRENQEIARLALMQLSAHFPLCKAAILQGLQAVPPCRFERHRREKEVVLDVAHNAHGFARLFERLQKVYPNRSLRLVVGFSKDKDLSSCAPLLLERSVAIHLVDAPHPRLAKATDLAKAFKQGPLFIEESVPSGIEKALGAPDKDEVVVIAGSFFIMNEARKAIGLKSVEDPRIWYDPLRVVQI